MAAENRVTVTEVLMQIKLRSHKSDVREVDDVFWKVAATPQQARSRFNQDEHRIKSGYIIALHAKS